MRQTGEGEGTSEQGEGTSERGSGNENEAEREIEDLGARLDAAGASRSGLNHAQRGMSRRSAILRILTIALWLATAVILLAMLLRMLPNSLDGKRYIPLIVALMPWLGLLSLIIVIAALAIRTIGGRALLAIIGVACVVIQISWHWGFLRPRQIISDTARTAVSRTVSGGLPNTADRYARIMTLNTKEGGADASQIVNTVKAEHVEILALQEVSADLINRLSNAGIANYLPYSVTAQQTWHDNGGVNVLYSAAPMEDVKQNLIPVESSSVPAATIDFAGTKVRFGSVHPFSPRPSNQGLWNKSLDSLAQLQHYDSLYVLMGDFNSTWDHASFRYLLGSRFLDSGEQAGEGLHMTYPAMLPVAEIDHIVHDKGVVVGDLETKHIPGSDHRALLATLEAR
ncbi:MAG: endonuclease/exonuclease/phosphatase family protein [Bifidobacterium ruminantium]|nr:endonuclease/exonuclease/phosphatase family protein [Bifidobacterium ruminantium]